MIRIKTRVILGTMVGILGLVWAAIPLYAQGPHPTPPQGVGNLCDGKFLFKMNIIGVSKDKNPPMTNTSRKTIFVRLEGKSDIFLTQGPFSVCDANSWDAAHDCTGATIGGFIGSVFQLPCNLNIVSEPGDPGPLFPCEPGVNACYDVFFRALGTPGGSVEITTCGIEPVSGDRICSSESAIISRGKGRPTFTKVTQELTSLVGCVTVAGVEVCGRFALFRDEFQQFLWQYDNQGLRNGMVVFCGADCD